MPLSSQEQFQKFLANSQEILILIPENSSAGEVGASFALFHFLKKQNKQPVIAMAGQYPEKFNFLPRPAQTLSEISGARDFVLSFDTTRNKIMKVSQEEKDGRFNILVTPEKGAIDPHDFSFILAKFNYDLLVVIGCSDLEKLGSLYEKNPDLFFEVPIVNIDHKSENDNFGQINLTDVTTSSSSEIVAQFLENSYPEDIDKNIATCLLTGLIGATDSFQKKNTTPKSLALAATLMGKDADQQEIVRWMYKTQPLRILKLWGRAMAKINLESESSLIWSEISVEDFVQSRSTHNDLPLILEKLEENYTDGKIFMALYNDTPETGVAVIKTGGEMMKKIYLALGGNINMGFLEIKFENPDLTATGKAIAEKIKSLV